MTPELMIFLASLTTGLHPCVFIHSQLDNNSLQFGQFPVRNSRILPLDQVIASYAHSTKDSSLPTIFSVVFSFTGGSNYVLKYKLASEKSRAKKQMLLYEVERAAVCGVFVAADCTFLNSDIAILPLKEPLELFVSFVHIYASFFGRLPFNWKSLSYWRLHLADRNLSTSYSSSSTICTAFSWTGEIMCSKKGDSDMNMK
ncbi:hypothetical protein HAX54_006413 [Datura stramonium]|uniref:Uncharacterized protein n=1 Tax=Datura stramonium TaxID=4076 RepID=A0ABS8TBG9_DATST|nr:hypothetical protein [Datura stramonium]